MLKCKKIMFLGFLSFLILSMSACNDKADENTVKANGDHVWQTQTDALQTAKDMAKKMQESLDLQKEKMDENN